MQTKPSVFLFWVSSCLFGRTPDQISFRYSKAVLIDEEYLKSKGIGPVIKEQEEQQFSNGTDGHQGSLILLFM
jgi:hypothetical protein